MKSDIDKGLVKEVLRRVSGDRKRTVKVMEIGNPGLVSIVNNRMKIRNAQEARIRGL